MSVPPKGHFVTLPVSIRKTSFARNYVLVITIPKAKGP
nr:MAG TPA: hypothetical protein [Caudoviricetes sp.]